MPRGQSTHESEIVQSEDPTVLGKNYNPFRIFDCVPGTVLNPVRVIPNLVPEHRISTAALTRI